jgi:hypothetical protein
MSTKQNIAQELHRPARKNYTRRRVNVYGKNDLWQADLMDMSAYARENSRYKYILCVIDCFTKFAWAVPLKSKKGVEVAAAARKIFAIRRPNFLQVDQGTEFYNSDFKMLLKKYDIHMYSTFTTMKACMAERLIRTIKGKMFRQFTARGRRDWISILRDLMHDYNDNSTHRTIGMTPAEADLNPEHVLLKQRVIAQSGKIRFTVGDKVRISVHKAVFTKSYLPSWSTEIFTIIKVNNTTPVTYVLEDYLGEKIAGSFYGEEIAKTLYPDDYLVEKIVRTKGARVFVKWMGFPSTHNSWINKSELKK